MTKTSRPKLPLVLTAKQVYEIAGAAGADPRTVRRVAAGLPTKGMVAARVLSALKSAGLLVVLLVIGCGIPKQTEEEPVAATVSLIQYLASGVTTSAGAALASGQARFYLPGTLTPVSAYSDSGGTTAITPPLVLTAGGTGVAYTKVPTRMIVKDSTATTTIFDGLVNIQRAEQQYIQSASVNGGTETTLQTLIDGIGTSFGGTAGLWKYKAYSSATERNLADVISQIAISVKDAGATGLGAQDDLTAIQNAVNAASALGGGDVLVPPGNYLISAAISLPSSVNLIGQSAMLNVTSTFTLTGAAANAVSIASSTTSNRIQNIAFSHSSTTSGAAISRGTSTATLVVDSVSMNGFYRYGINGQTSGGLGGQNFVTNSYFATDSNAAAIGIQDAGNSSSYYLSSTQVYGQASGVSFSSSSLLVASGGFISGLAATGVGIILTGSTGRVTASGTAIAGGASGHAINIGASSGAVLFDKACLLSPDVNDARGAAVAPVAYTFSGSGNFTPLPLQTEHIRVIATAAVTVTINAIAATGYGRKWSLYCINSSGGAVVWTFNTQYKLAGGAAPAPATGNMVVLLLEYDPISAVVREVSRSGTVAI